MEISRQDWETEIHELAKKPLDQLIGFGPGGAEGYCALYLQTNGVWYRFFVQAQSLFFYNSLPDPEDDLNPGEEYIDVLAALNLPPHLHLDSLVMKDGCFSIRVDRGILIVCSENLEEGTTSVKIASS